MIYLIENGPLTFQSSDLPINGNTLGKVHDGMFKVYRFFDGKFQRLYAVSEEYGTPVRFRWKAEWQDVVDKPAW